MQIDRTHTSSTSNSTLFAPAHGQPDPADLELSAVPAGRNAVPTSTTPPVLTEGVVLKLSSKTPDGADQPVYSKAQIFGAPKIDLNSMTLENQLALGRNQGVFTKITLSKDGVLLVKPDVARSPASPEFVASAVTAMRDFQEGIALLKEQTPDGSTKTSNFFAEGLRTLQHAAAKLNVFA